MSTLSRRSFLETGAIAGTIAATGLRAKNSAAAALRFRTLGKTGYKVSEVGFGVMNNRDEELVRAAIDTGINYLDTAHSYMNGVNEEIIGKVMTTERDKVFLTTKLKASSSDQLQTMIETSLKRLQTDHVDCIMLHGVSNASDFMNQEMMDTFGEFRDKGLAKYIGVSTHTNMSGVVDTVTDSEFWDLVTVSYNFTATPELTEAIVRARKAGIAIVAMKTQSRGTGYADEANDTVSAQQAALKWVLDNESVDTTIPGMTSFEHLAENVAVMGMKLTQHDKKEINRYAERLKGNYCYGVSDCTGCNDKCPKGVAINDINRCIGYAQGYGDMRLARENYNRLPEASRVDACGDCTECQVKCVNGLDLTHQMKLARNLFC